jgi:putative aldouronate transport system substrate-binding protein
MKSMLALPLAVALSVSMFAGCSSKDGSTSESSASPQASPAATASAAPAVKLNKDAKLRIAVPENGGVKGFEPGADESNNQFLKALREKTGYKNLEVTVIPGANALEKFNLMFASGDVYDLIYTMDFGLFRRFSEQNALLALDGLVTQSGGEISKNVAESSWAAVTKNNQKYAIPIPPSQYNNGQALGSGFLVRQDWMEKLGLTAPKNLDELYTFLKTIKDKDPSGKGTIPMTAASNGGNPLGGLDVITAAFGMSGITDIPVPFTVKDGKLINAEDIYLKDALAYISKLYKEGLIDNEYLFNKTAQANEKITSGKAASSYAGYWDVKTYRSALLKTDPNVKYTFLPPVAGPDGRKGYSKPAAASNIFFVPKTAKYANEAVDLLNSYLLDKELQSFIAFGTEGVHYENVNGEFTPKQPAYDSIIYKIYYQMWSTPEIWFTKAKLAGYEQDIKNFTSGEPQLSVVNINLYRPQSQTELAKSKTLVDLRYEYFSKIITGALPLTAVDEYFKKADAAGRQDIIKENQDWYEKEGKAMYEKLIK